MKGFAKQLFVEHAAKRPWKETPAKKGASWPILECMLELQFLDYVDFALAQRLLEKEFLHSDASQEDMAALICHLSMSARQGHLCVTIDESEIYPHPNEVWLPPNRDVEVSETKDSLKGIAALLLSAIKCSSTSIVGEVSEHTHFPSTPICKQGNRYYLQRYWIEESFVLEQAASLFLQVAPKICLDDAHVALTVDALIENKTLLPQQGKAIRQACKQSLSIITGGPGTGKTYTAGLYIRIFWKSLTNEQKAECRIGLAAPTGKAAANLEASIQSALQGLESRPSLAAQTLHSLLGIGRIYRNQAAMVLPYDLMLVDESSMIDVRMMGRLLSAMKPGARLILLGDRYQLPPIEAGSLFADLVSILQNHPKRHSHLIELKTCLRAELQEIVDLAELINRGNAQEAFELLTKAPAGGGIQYCSFDSLEGHKEQQNSLLEYSMKLFPRAVAIPDNPYDLLKEFARFRILTPTRKGPLGVEALNALLLQAAWRQAKDFRYFIAPIMIVRNDYRLELFNGEMGLYIKEILSKESFFHCQNRAGYALFPSRDKRETKEKGLPEGSEWQTLGIRKIPSLLLPAYEYAYCLSVHKSQGSEFEQVLMVLPEGCERFGRETLYTGITRARKSIHIWASSQTLIKMIKNVGIRHSGIKERISHISLFENKGEII